MADISRLLRLSSGERRQVDLSVNTLVLENVKLMLGTAFAVTFSGTPSADRTISMPDANVDLGAIANLATLSGVALNEPDLGTFTGATIPDDSTIKAALQALETAHEEVDQNVNDLISLSGVAENASTLGTFTGSVISDNQTIKQALQALETYAEASRSLIENFEWQESALDYVVDNTAAPASEVSGDRYILSHDGGAPHADYDGASAGDIVEFNGSVWVATTPTLGTFISADDEPTLLYYWGGSSWSAKYFESTTASTGLTKVGFDIRLNNANTNGINVASGVISANVDDSTIERGAGDGNPLQVKDLGITTAKLAADAVGAAKIRLENNTYLRARNQANGADVNILKVNASDIIEFASFPITPSSAPTTDYQVANKKYVDDSVAAASAEYLRRIANAGEALSSGLKAMRWAKAADAGFVAGRLYRADNDASSVDNFHVAGVFVAAGTETAGTSITIVKQGKLTATAHGFTVGQPIYLSASGALTGTAPSSTNSAIVKVGMAEDANTIDVQIEVVGIN